jgi:hypothetical protein
MRLGFIRNAWHDFSDDPNFMCLNGTFRLDIPYCDRKLLVVAQTLVAA